MFEIVRKFPTKSAEASRPLKPGRAHTSAVPATGFFEVEIQAEPEQARIDRPLLQTACRIAPSFRLITTKEFDSVVNHLVAKSSPIAGYPIPEEPI